MLIYRGSFSVFSTYVEVILVRYDEGVLVGRILHVCGGDPYADHANADPYVYSPRMWR